MTKTEPQPPAAKEAPRIEEQKQIVKPVEENRGQPEKARETEKDKSGPAAVEARPEAKHETKPDAKVESKPPAERPVAARQPTEQKDGKDEEKKD